MTGATKAGPKGKRSMRALPPTDGEGVEAVVNWIQRWCITPKGHGAREPMSVRPWQRDLLAPIFDPDEPPAIALWSLPRGSGKTTLAGALGLWGLLGSGVEGARVPVIAADERQAGLTLSVASRMVELHPSLEKRCLVYRDRIVVPRTDSHLVVLPAEHHRLEGLDVAPIAIVDEIGVVDRRCWESILHGSTKRPATVLAIGTPSPPSHRDTSPMQDLVAYGREHPDDETFLLREQGAPPGADIADETVWEAAVPGLDDLVTRQAMRSLLPPKTRAAEYARARLGIWVDQVADPFLAPGEWAACEVPRPIPDGHDVVLALDGSFSQDATAIVAATVSAEPHLDVVALWEPPPHDDGSWRVPIADVEQAVRDAARRYNVVEVVADPFRWQRSLQALAAEGLPMVEMPQTAARMTPATTGLREAVTARAVTHSGDDRLARHMSHAMVKVDARGERLSKDRRGSSRRIDAAVCAVMAHSRATFHAHQAKPSRRAVAFF